MTKKEKLTPAQLKRHIKAIREAIEQDRCATAWESFTTITPQEIEAKLKLADTPIIVAQGWSPLSSDRTFHYGVNVYNPGSGAVSSLMAHVWIGSGHVAPDDSTFLLNVDTRFPRLTEPKFSGLKLGSKEIARLDFHIKVPSTVENTNYIGNCALMQMGWNHKGFLCDRSGFVFAVS